jgi:serine/threonine protein phosphatase PrpC
MGELAISRSIGDRPFAQYLSREPGVSVVKLQRGVHRFVVIASDGVWDVMSDDEAVRMVEEVLAVHWDQRGGETPLLFPPPLSSAGPVLARQ